MADFITLSCPACGGKLQITNDIERFMCAHCGSEMLVRRGEGIISLKPIIEDVKSVRRATDHTAAELAIVRIEKEIGELRKAWFSMPTKGTSSVFGQIVFVAIPVLLVTFGSLTFFPLLAQPNLRYLLLIHVLLAVSWFIMLINRVTKKKAHQAEISLLIAQKQNELDKFREIINSN